MRSTLGGSQSGAGARREPKEPVLFVTKRRAKKSDAFFLRRVQDVFGCAKWMRKSTVDFRSTWRAVRTTAKRGPPFAPRANSWKKVSSREASSFAIGKCRPSKLEPRRHSFASPSRTPVIHSSGGVCCDRCVPTKIAVSLASPATGSLPVRGGIFRRARPSPHFSFPKPPTPVIGRVRRVATVRCGNVRASAHVWGLLLGLVLLNRAEGHREVHTEDCAASRMRLHAHRPRRRMATFSATCPCTRLAVCLERTL